MPVFKLVKKTDWTASSKEKGTTLVLALEGRVYNANQGDFTQLKIDTAKNTVTIDDKVVVTKETYVGTDGLPKNGLRLKPKSTLEFAEF